MLKDLCSCKITNSLKIEADFVADAIWCNQCGENLDIEDFPITENLKVELNQWTGLYKKISIKEHNSRGEHLTEKVKEELGPEYKIVFIPDRK
ncbi:hypothetical protein [Peribacillus deserti]|uniref:Uncharacterized protein n=1 Tax=Peribacillus deserti TaxID=673318 RepID=A0A2N5M1M6_9BACI|nr:hypothetical protein [Peribacillus deserti]PLT28183.1 hypothetical protein CUU66_19770 [Peribacillus deserti]